jgi:hypothetical protein
MTKSQYHAIRQALSFRRCYLPIALFLSVDAVLFSLGLWLVVQGGTAGYGLAPTPFPHRVLSPLRHVARMRPRELFTVFIS